MKQESKLPDYFAFYGLPIQFNPDLNAIKAKFYSFSKKYHPDFYVNENEEKQLDILNLSTLNNKAYQILTNPLERLKYVLELKGIVETDEAYQLPQSFLMEMMDVNESLMDLEFNPDAEKLFQLNNDVNSIEKQLETELERLLILSDKSASQPEGLLSSIKDIYYRKKYINRIRERLPKNNI